MGAFLERTSLAPQLKDTPLKRAEGGRERRHCFTAERLFVRLLQLVDEHPIRNKCINGQLSTTGVRLQ